MPLVVASHRISISTMATCCSTRLEHGLGVLNASACHVVAAQTALSYHALRACTWPMLGQSLCTPRTSETVCSVSFLAERRHHTVMRPKVRACKYRAEANPFVGCSRHEHFGPLRCCARACDVCIVPTLANIDKLTQDHGPSVPISFSRFHRFRF